MVARKVSRQASKGKGQTHESGQGAACAGAFSSLRYRKTRDRVIELLLLACGLVAVFTTLAIVFILFYESSFFFETVSIKDFLTDTMWTPLFADARYGIAPLVAGTLTVTGVALFVAIPLGTIIASTCPNSRPTACARPSSRSSSCSAPCRPSSMDTSRSSWSRHCCRS